MIHPQGLRAWARATVFTGLLMVTGFVQAGPESAQAVKSAKAFRLLEASDLAGIKKMSAEDLRSLVNLHGETLLIRAIATDKEVIANYLADAKRSDLDRRDKAGSNALLYAVSQSNAKLSKTLIQAGAKLDLTYGENAESLLFEAVRGGDAEVIALLIKAQPSLVNKLDDKGKSPVEEAVSSAQLGTALKLITEFGGQWPQVQARRQTLVEELRKFPKNPAAKELLRRLTAVSN